VIVELAAEAERDLETIGDRIARDNLDRAVTFIAELLDACVGLAKFPQRFPLVPRYEDRGVRHRLHGNYLIFYRIEREKIVVVHILHGAMDYAGLLFGE
jgi:toxin ParE1/3/4